MIELLLFLMMMALIGYIYYNEKLLKRGKIPFSNRLEECASKKKSVRKSAL